MQVAPDTAFRRIEEVADVLGLERDELELHGRHAAKIELGAIERRRSAADGKLICVTAVTPTKAGEGKTTTAISLTDALGRAEQNVVLCLREPSLGPVFGGVGVAVGDGQDVGVEAFGIRDCVVHREDAVVLCP